MSCSSCVPLKGHVLNMVLTTTDRKQITRSFNGSNIEQRVVTPFRAINNAGDLLARKNYNCGGPSQVTNSRRRQSNSMFRGTVRSNCDSSGIPGAACNPKYVYDSSTYSRYKRLMANQKNYNDSSYGGDLHNGSKSFKL